ncbi:uncharacterized protein LOC108248684 [Kryptolebias marmoratus]|uniref:uncharacterized protein LOC108248684 n=1 Tax=Kryptolebias marmoratus TaxID=37003 RepID=UPI0007F9226D|nr:uncharacterized protein LOC108248684 [Kryptolebias marmoratus]
MKMLVVFGILLHISQHALAGVVEVNKGAESVLMPCHYKGQIPDDNPSVTWTRNELNPNLVHLSRDERDYLIDQNQIYRDRTSMTTDPLETGDFSLTLRKPKLSDSGNYSCKLGDRRQELTVTEVRLTVKDQQVQVEVKEGAESVILPCRTTANLPEDARVEWTRSDPVFMFIHVFPNTSKHHKDQDELYCGRTEMNKDLLRTGDLSLTLKSPTDRDSGSYICTVYRDQDILRHKVVLKQVKGFPAWATAVLILLFVVLPACGGVLFFFRQYYIPVYKVKLDSGVESVLLPCKTTVCLHKIIKVEWKDKDERNVHVFENGSDQPEEQDQFYKNRTKMNKGLLRIGDLSLTLKYPTVSETFTCTVYSSKGDILMKKEVLLQVKVQQVEVHSGVDSVLLPCKTTVHLPEETKVEWTDSKDRKVHVFENGSDQPGIQFWFYKNRTKVNEDLLSTGDLSLTLTQPTVSETFTCTVYSRKGDILMKKPVQLEVKEKDQVQDPQEDISLMTNQSV